MGETKVTVNGLDFDTAMKWAHAYELTQKVNIDRLLDISEKYTKLKEFIFDSFSWCAGADDGFVVINSDWKVCELLEELEPVAHAIAKKRAYDEKFEAERKKLEGEKA